MPVVIRDPFNKKEIRIPLKVDFGNPINQKEVRIPLTRCHWRSNYQKGGWDTINRLSLEIQLTKKEPIIPLTDCH